MTSSHRPTAALTEELDEQLATASPEALDDLLSGGLPSIVWNVAA